MSQILDNDPHKKGMLELGFQANTDDPEYPHWRKDLPNGYLEVDNSWEDEDTITYVAAVDITFTAYDKNDNDLGWTGDLAEAEHQVEHSYISNPRNYGDLEFPVWAAWNDLLDGEETPLTDGTVQIMHLKGGIFIVASKVETGWETTLIDESDLYEKYGNEDNHVLTLTVAEEPWRLE